MHRIMFFCALIVSSCAAYAMDISTVSASDRAQFLSRIRQIQYAVNYRDEPKVSPTEQSDFLKMHYTAIEALAKKYGIIHPDERNFLWLCSLEDALKPDEQPNKKEVAKAIYEKAQKITQD